MRCNIFVTDIGDHNGLKWRVNVVNIILYTNVYVLK